MTTTSITIKVVYNHTPIASYWRWSLPPVSKALAKLVAKFAASVVDTSGQFAVCVVDTGGNFATCVIDTGGRREIIL